MILSKCITVKQQKEWKNTFIKSANVSKIRTRLEINSKFKNHFEGYQLGDIYPLQIKNKHQEDKIATTHFILVEVDDYNVIKSDFGKMLELDSIRTKIFMDLDDLRIINKSPVILKKRTATWIIYGTMNNEGGFTENNRKKIMNCKLRFISDVYMGNQIQQLVVTQSTCPSTNEELYHHVVYTLKAAKDTISTVKLCTSFLIHTVMIIYF